ncbi:MAG: tRNA (guanosine(37)-N1)-methyltransferase TrmD [Patescibacteria group bacterium]|nr:tRNA (guanosine(37)-N1)-methyltransferase TrmD [Patescibacteria group bacterium]
MKFDILTIFPDIFDSYFNETILKRAQSKKLVSIHIHDIRKATADKHHKVDDRPYGGGPGMVLKINPIYKTLKKIRQKKNSKIILLDPAGKQFDHDRAKKYALLDQMTFICGRYEGVDARVEKLIDEKVSIGPYVLSGGEIPTMIIIEAVARLIPGVLGHKDSALDDSFSRGKDYVEFPQYTRPEKFKQWAVPKVLLSGDHKKIAKWREEQVKKAKSRRGKNV